MTPRQIEYRAYLTTDHWKGLRAEVLRRDGRRCVHCGKKKGCLQVHHRFYRSRFEDSIADDLVTLCERCHKAEHGLAKKKTIRQPKLPKPAPEFSLAGEPKNLKELNWRRSNRMIDRESYLKFREKFGGAPKPASPLLKNDRREVIKQW